jgi:hypothetical protein
MKYFVSFWHVLTFWGFCNFMYMYFVLWGTIYFVWISKYWIQFKFCLNDWIWWVTLYEVCLDTWHTSRVSLISSWYFEIVWLFNKGPEMTNIQWNSLRRPLTIPYINSHLHGWSVNKGWVWGWGKLLRIWII